MGRQPFSESLTEVSKIHVLISDDIPAQLDVAVTRHTHDRGILHTTVSEQFGTNLARFDAETPYFDLLIGPTIEH